MIAARPTVVVFAPSPFPLSLSLNIIITIAKPVLILIAAPIETIILKINKLTISFENEENNDPAAIIITPYRYIFFLPTLSEILPMGNKTATTVIVDTREIQAAEDKSNEKSFEMLGKAMPIMLASITAVKRPNAMDIKESHFCFWLILIFLIIICSQAGSLGKELLCCQIRHMTDRKPYC